MKCPKCHEELKETKPRVYYCQTSGCEVAYVILSGAKVKVVDEQNLQTT